MSENIQNTISSNNGYHGGSLLNNFLSEIASGVSDSENGASFAFNQENGNQTSGNATMSAAESIQRMVNFNNISQSNCGVFLDEELLQQAETLISCDWSTMTSSCVSAPPEVERTLNGDVVAMGNSTDGSSINEALKSFLAGFNQNFNDATLNTTEDSFLHIPQLGGQTAGMNTNLLASQVDHSGAYLNQGIGQILTPLTRTLNSLNSNWVNLDSEAAIRNYLPMFFEGLTSGNPSLVHRSSHLLSQLTKREPQRTYLLNSCGPSGKLSLIATMLSVVVNFRNDGNIVKTVTSTLYHISSNKQMIKVLHQTGCIPLLVSMLDYRLSTEITLFYCVATLHNICLHSTASDEIKNVVRSGDSVKRLVSLLQNSNPKFLAIITDCLHLISVNHRETQIMILSLGGPQELVNIIRTNAGYEKLLYTTCRLLKSLSVCPECKKVIVNCGGMHALSSLLLHQSRRLAANAIWTMRNLSDAANSESGLDQLLGITVRFLHSQLPSSISASVAQATSGEHSESITNRFSNVAINLCASGISERTLVSCAVGIIANLTCNNVFNKEFVVNSGGVEALIGICFASAQSVGLNDILEPAVCALRHLTAKHSFSMKSCQLLFAAGGHELMSSLLKSPFPEALNSSTLYKDRNDNSQPFIRRLLQAVQLKRAIFGLFCNIASHSKFLPVLREMVLTPQVIFVLSFINSLYREPASVVNENFIGELQSFLQSTQNSNDCGPSINPAIFQTQVDRLIEAGTGLLYLCSNDSSLGECLAQSKIFVMLLLQLFLLTDHPGTLDSITALIFKLSDRSHLFNPVMCELFSSPVSSMQSHNCENDISSHSNEATIGILVVQKLGTMIQTLTNTYSGHFDCAVSNSAANLLVRLCQAVPSLNLPGTTFSSDQNDVNNSPADYNLHSSQTNLIHSPLVGHSNNFNNSSISINSKNSNDLINSNSQKHYFLGLVNNNGAASSSKDKNSSMGTGYF